MGQDRSCAQPEPQRHRLFYIFSQLFCSVLSCLIQNGFLCLVIPWILKKMSDIFFQIVCVWEIFISQARQAVILAEVFFCLASSIKSLCSCNHGSETVRSHSDNQNKTPPTATQHEARFKTSSKENHKNQCLRPTLMSDNNAPVWSVKMSQLWNRQRCTDTGITTVPQAFRARLHIAYEQVITFLLSRVPAL